VNRQSATVVSAIWFVLAPGLAAGLVPWWITGWHASAVWAPLRVLGALLILAGTAVTVYAFAQFVRQGLGTPLPLAAPQRLVVGGLYRYVRNPMYLASLSVIGGQALLLGRIELLWYAIAVLAGEFAFVRWYEEPHLRREFGAQYEEYRRAVPGWWPRLTPWTG
jgi:protein-S-isoprenylcysteine O-methyltransferase Ste14